MVVEGRPGLSKAELRLGPRSRNLRARLGPCSPASPLKNREPKGHKNMRILQTIDLEKDAELQIVGYRLWI